MKNRLNFTQPFVRERHTLSLRDKVRRKSLLHHLVCSEKRSGKKDQSAGKLTQLAHSASLGGFARIKACSVGCPPIHAVQAYRPNQRKPI